jgi:hypothetical protein
MERSSFSCHTLGFRLETTACGHVAYAPQTFRCTPFACNPIIALVTKIRVVQQEQYTLPTAAESTLISSSLDKQLHCKHTLKTTVCCLLYPDWQVEH